MRAMKSFAGGDALRLPHYMQVSDELHAQAALPPGRASQVPTEWRYSMRENIVNIYNGLNKFRTEKNKFNLKKHWISS
jgi:hypothetical protein